MGGESKKKCEIKRVGALRKLSWGIKGWVEGGLQKKCKIKRVGALRGGWREDC